MQNMPADALTQRLLLITVVCFWCVASPGASTSLAYIETEKPVVIVLGIPAYIPASSGQELVTTL